MINFLLPTWKFSHKSNLAEIYCLFLHIPEFVSKLFCLGYLHPRSLMKLTLIFFSQLVLVRFLYQDYARLIKWVIKFFLIFHSLEEFTRFGLFLPKCLTKLTFNTIWDWMFLYVCNRFLMMDSVTLIVIWLFRSFSFHKFSKLHFYWNFPFQSNFQIYWHKVVKNIHWSSS